MNYIAGKSIEEQHGRKKVIERAKSKNTREENNHHGIDDTSGKTARQTAVHKSEIGKDVG